MTSPRVADLTVGQFRELCRETFTQVVEEVLDDPDRGLALHDDVAKRLERSLAEVDAGGTTVSHAEVAERLRTSR